MVALQGSSLKGGNIGAMLTGVGVKMGSDDKFGQGALEYLYQPNVPHDSKKKEKEILDEKLMAQAYDRIAESQDAKLAERAERLLVRLNAAMDAVPPS